MSPLSAHSRRALVAASAAMATAPVATAKKKKGKKKKKSPAPLAFAVGIVTDLSFSPDPTFTCNVVGGWRYPAGGIIETFGNAVPVAFGTGDQIRAQIAVSVQEHISISLDVVGHDVPADRIAVTLL
jgi:hypothetical protein